MSITNKIKFFPLVKKGFEKVATGLEVAWESITGKPSVFPPEAHTHPYIPETEKGIANGVATLDFNNKLTQIQIPDSLLGQVSYQGQYNASTNTPALPEATTVKGNYYIVSAAGTVNSVYYEIGDWIISDGVSWSKVDNTDAVSSVFGRTGNIIAQAADYEAFFAEKQTTKTDTTPGRGLITGAFGLNLAITSEETNINNYLTGGMYLTPLSNLTNIPIWYNNNYRHHLFVINSSTYIFQLLIPSKISTNAGQMAFRLYMNSIFSEWFELRPEITLSATEPTSPQDGDIWILP